MLFKFEKVKLIHLLYTQKNKTVLSACSVASPSASFPVSVCFLSFAYLWSSYLLLWGCFILSPAVSASPSSTSPAHLASAKLMNGYMVLTNGGSQPRASPSVSPRTFSRPAGDVFVNMDNESHVRKMDTVVKLDAVRVLFLCLLASVNVCGRLCVKASNPLTCFCKCLVPVCITVALVFHVTPLT